MKKEKIRNLTILGLLAALMLLFGFTPLGMINVGVVYVTLLCLPVIIGTLTLGLKSGMSLTLFFGTISFLTPIMRGPSASIAPIMSRSVFLLLPLCYLPRLFIPVVTIIVYRAVDRINQKWSVILGALLGSFSNTVLYLGSILLMYLILGIDSSVILAGLGGTVLFAGIPEAVVAALVTYPVVFALRKSGLIGHLDARPADPAE